MPVTLTEEQLSSIAWSPIEPARVIDPRTRTTYVLVLESDYELIRELIEDERDQRALHDVALRNAAKRILDDE